jgi:putative chitinase
MIELLKIIFKFFSEFILSSKYTVTTTSSTSIVSITSTTSTTKNNKQIMEQKILDKLKGHIPDSVLLQIPETTQKFNITTVLRLAHFLSQCAHESANFTAVKENLNYSADGLKKIFGKYFPGTLNESYARKPDKIASRVYGNRMGNGDEASGDGYKYSGRGYLQTTGKVNYAAFGKFINEDLLTNPGLVATKYPLMSAAFFFETNKLWSICDKGSSTQVVTELTKRINGGTNGIDDRLSKFNMYYNLLK